MQLIAREAIGGHRRFVRAAAFSPDGARFATGDRGGDVIVRGRSAPEIRVGGADIRALAWTPCGEHLVVLDYPYVRVRRADDLSEVAAERRGGTALGIGGDGTYAAVLGETSAQIVGLPGLVDRGWCSVYRSGYEYFSASAFGVDPRGGYIAISDDGGSTEAAMAPPLDHGIPQTTLFDVDSREAIARIEAGEYVHTLIFDPWRDRLVVGAHGGLVDIWRRDGSEMLHRFHPYPDKAHWAVAVTPLGILTVRGSGDVPPATLDLWHPETFELLASAEVPRRFPPRLIVASPDGRTLLTEENLGSNDYGVRVWTVDGA
ncbi:MAG TPA: WD40 repeat domain-containing protein [Micromonosporaceae bacterium]